MADEREREEDRLGDLGNRHFEEGRFSDAIGCFEAALEIARARADPASEFIWLGNLGTVYLQTGQLAKSIDALEQAVTLARSVSDLDGELDLVLNLAVALAHSGEAAYCQKAARLLTNGLSQAPVRERPRRHAAYHGHLGNILSMLGVNAAR